MRLCLKVELQGYLGLVVKSDIQGYNWTLTIFDFVIIFHLKNYVIGVIIFITTSRVTVKLFFLF